MSDSKPVFNDDEDGVTREIEENEERHADTHDESIESTLEKAIRPITNALSRDPLDADQQEAQRRENDSEQSSS